MGKRMMGITVLLVFCLVAAAAAQTPQKFNFQGQLKDAGGNPVNGSVEMTFTIYDAETAGNVLWTETQDVTVTDGVYNVMLGEADPFDTELPSTIPLWLGVQVAGDSEMSPLVEITPGPYTMILMNQVTVKDGNVGIGATNPDERLEVNGKIKSENLTVGAWPSDSNYVFFGTNNLDQTAMGNFALLQHISNGRTFLNSPDTISFQINNSDKMTIANDGNIGIGTNSPVLHNGSSNQILEIEGDHNPGIAIDNTEINRQWLIHVNEGEGQFRIYDSDAPAIRFAIDPNGNVGIGTYHPSYKLHVAGTMKADGADLAEPFDMTDIESLELGDVVVIDPLNPLHVTKSTTAYATTVAGIVSSNEQAGYVAGSRSDGSSDKPIALAGRVLCKVSTENGAIQVGDLLTTSSTPGYAMKATDRDNAFGAVLGKALQAFDGDKGQIMVLVALQ